ncbi:hypothetical protein Q7P37_008190 [Cladosporium fusiforme]
MPYTPPSQQSPASSKSTSPVVSRSSSMSEDVPRSPITGRPQLPRSHSSASYMSRQRRSPSITNSDGPRTPNDTITSTVQSTDFATRSSVRQSPPPVNDLVMPTGAVISPPDSDNSDSEESKQRGRELEIAELQKAVRSIDLRREGSPDKVGKHLQQTESEPVSQTTSPSALTPEARKISHSRSNTAEIVISRPTFVESPTQSTDESDNEDDGPLSKPSLVRKKSGELVKPALRPSSRRRYSSMPGTPTYHKSVHFNDNDNQTRHFLQVDKPMAVSAGSSPVETYDSETEYPFEYNTKSTREMKLANFPQDTFERKLKPVRVERLFLSPDKETLVGTVAVQNLSFQKLVVARFTLDHWRTTSEVVAEYNNDRRQPMDDGCDKFNFNIKLSDSANIESKTMLLCVRYNVNGQDYWDNNDDRNYQIDFVKSVKKPKVLPNSQLGARPLNAIPRSRHLPPNSLNGRGRSESTDDEFGTRFDLPSTYQFSTPDKIITESGGSIKLKPKPKRPTVLPTGPAQSHNNLGGRYDFGASLSAALSTAQDRLGRNSGFMTGAPQKPNEGYFSAQQRNDAPIATKEEKPDFSVSAGSSDRPAMGSAQYRDLVSKFCYFTSSGTGKGTSSPQTNRSANKPAAADGTDDDASITTASSGSSSPQTPVDDFSERKGGSPLGPFVHQSSSQSPFSGQVYTHRTASPASFGYPYPNSMRDGYFDSPQPTAIRG